MRRQATSVGEGRCAPGGVWFVVASDGRVVEWPEETSRSLAIPAARALGQGFPGLVADTGRPLVCRHLASSLPASARSSGALFSLPAISPSSG
jgi:Mg-chelatase subunit ChlD